MNPALIGFIYLFLIVAAVSASEKGR